MLLDLGQMKFESLQSFRFSGYARATEDSQYKRESDIYFTLMYFYSICSLDARLPFGANF